jgi:mono/diheme cytochrome c family protein
MSEHKPVKKSAEPKAFGWVAEYEDENQLLDAARKVRDSGYTKTDAFTPFPVHGIDEALGIKPTVLPWFTLIAGATGTTVALTMQIWTNAIDYPYIISGKPYVSLPAFIPVAFELTVLFAAFTTVFAMLGLNGLPRFSNPIFTNPKFDRASDDRFFLWVDSRDKYFNSEKVHSLLTDTGAIGVDEVREDDSSTEVPRFLYLGIFALILASLIPGAIVLNMRNAKSGSSRFHVFFDMDFQPKRKTQTPIGTDIFENGRVQQPPVAGTVARGDIGDSDEFLLGYTPTADMAMLVAGDTRLVSFQEEEARQEEAKQEDTKSEQEGGGESAAAQESDSNEADAGGEETTAEAADESSEDGAAEEAGAMADAGAGEPNLNWVKEFPLEVNDALYALGKKKFEQNCAVCHGYGGYGDGLVSQRALSLAQGYWLQPTSLHEDRIQKQDVGRIYYTVANGKGKMGGYKASLTPEERWAVVFYVRALQRSQNASEADAPGKF